MRSNDIAKLMAIRKTLFLEFNRGTRIQSTFLEEVMTTVQQAASVSELKPMATLEIRDLGSVTIREKEENAV